MKSSIFIDDRITTEPNIDQKYKHKGIIEVSHTVVINPFNQIFIYCFRNNYNNEYNICKIKIQEILNKKHKTIIIGKLNTHKILKSCGLNNKINRLLQVQSHYKFRTKLNLLCKDNKSNLIVQEEQFTTKTCGNCGCINENVGSNKIFKCDKCNLIADRDFHAARNILIKFLTLNQ